jgi:DNA mismatch endonuclease (patch repair protein)
MERLRRFDSEGDAVAGERRQTPSPKVSAQMQAQRRRDTSPEMLLRRELHRLGLRYRLGYPVPGMARRTIDIAFPGPRVAVFVDGCFWHMCPEHATWPKNNAEWWRAKLEANSRRDVETSAHLTAHGWRVVRIWEHDEVGESVNRVVETVSRRASV